MKGGTTQVGKIYRKTPLAGFGARREMFVRVEDPSGPCMMGCGDDDCQEYANCYEVEASGKETGEVVYHVSECQLSPRDSL